MILNRSRGRRRRQNNEALDYDENKIERENKLSAIRETYSSLLQIVPDKDIRCLSLLIHYLTDEIQSILVQQQPYHNSNNNSNHESSFNYWPNGLSQIIVSYIKEMTESYFQSKCDLILHGIHAYFATANEQQLCLDNALRDWTATAIMRSDDGNGTHNASLDDDVKPDDNGNDNDVDNKSFTNWVNSDAKWFLEYIAYLVALYAGGYGWDPDLHDSMHYYSHNGRVAYYTRDCRDVVCAQADEEIYGNCSPADPLWYAEVYIHSKCDEMWIGVCWDPTMVTTQYGWGVRHYKKMVCYYGGRESTMRRQKKQWKRAQFQKEMEAFEAKQKQWELEAASNASSDHIVSVAVAVAVPALQSLDANNDGKENENENEIENDESGISATAAAVVVQSERHIGPAQLTQEIANLTLAKNIDSIPENNNNNNSSNSSAIRGSQTQRVRRASITNMNIEDDGSETKDFSYYERKYELQWNAFHFDINAYTDNYGGSLVDCAPGVIQGYGKSPYQYQQAVHFYTTGDYVGILVHSQERWVRFYCNGVFQGEKIDLPKAADTDTDTGTETDAGAAEDKLWLYATTDSGSDALLLIRKKWDKDTKIYGDADAFTEAIKSSENQPTVHLM